MIFWSVRDIFLKANFSSSEFWGPSLHFPRQQHGTFLKLFYFAFDEAKQSKTDQWHIRGVNRDCPCVV
jgi:hypothetical protein